MRENANEIPEGLEKLNSRVFSENLHTKCKVHTGPSDTIELELIEEAERPTSPQKECVSVLVQGTVSPVLPQRIGKMEHPRRGAFDLFLTPLGVNESGATYEAVFHRHRKPNS